MIVVHQTDNGRTVNAPLAGVVRIVLPENATTGYRWTVDRFDSEFIEALATEPHYSGNAVGSGGQVEFVFKARRAGRGTICLKQWRHWEGDRSIVGGFCVHLRIDGPSEALNVPGHPIRAITR